MTRTTKVLLLAAAAIGAGLAIVLVGSDPSDSPIEVAVPAAKTSLNSESSQSTSPDTQEIQPAQEFSPYLIREAELALQRAREMRAAAQAEFDRLELDVEAMEVYVAEMEARGEDPVDHSDEVMARFSPILAEYLDAEVRFDAAENAEQEAAAKLAAARNSTGRTTP